MNKIWSSGVWPVSRLTGCVLAQVKRIAGLQRCDWNCRWRAECKNVAFLAERVCHSLLGLLNWPQKRLNISSHKTISLSCVNTWKLVNHLASTMAFKAQLRKRRGFCKYFVSCSSGFSIFGQQKEGSQNTFSHFLFSFSFYIYIS